MNEGEEAQKVLEELAEIIQKNESTVRPDYVVGWYRLWTRLPALERVLIRKGLITQEEVDKEQLQLLEASKKDFKKV